MLTIPRISQLDELTIGHIAAGEVVECPAQVVKELLENSLDAKATKIDIDIQKGGFDRLEVRDNGHGILSDDLAKAVDRHATSKLHSHTDLAEIHTLGFRGEALASIGVVSELSLSSRPEGEEGARITVIDGEKGPVEPCGMPQGTSAEVLRIFSNQPARLAFQRRPATETTRIVDVVVQHALAHPECSFRLVADERQVLSCPASEDFVERMYDLIGAQSSRMLTLESPPLDDDAPGEERWSGWISPPEVTRGKGNDIHILINGRPVAAQPFIAAIKRGYKTRLMVGRHPVAILHLTLPVGEVDVNVHPTKREVRLRHSWRVLERLERAISHTLSTVATEPDPGGEIAGLRSMSSIRESALSPLVDREGGVETSPSEPHSSKARITSVGKRQPKLPAWVTAASTQLDLSGQLADEVGELEKPRPISVSPASQQSLTAGGIGAIAPPLSSQERELHRHSHSDVATSPVDEPGLEGVVNDLPAMEPLAQFADSYILAQAEGELLLIDQHALHERVRYERLRHSESAWQPQSRITPLKLELEVRQAERLNAHRERLGEVGFRFESIDHEWHCIAAPSLVPEGRVRQFIDDLLQDLGDDSAPLETLERRQDYIAFMQSCRGAVKANQKLNLAEMRRLLEDMRRIPNPWACVHGRPTALRFPINQLDQHFGRHG